MDNTYKEKYGGNYIITTSFNSDDVVIFGENPEEVYNKAVDMGIKEPVIDYVEKEGVICLY